MYDLYVNIYIYVYVYTDIETATTLCQEFKVKKIYSAATIAIYIFPEFKELPRGSFRSELENLPIQPLHDILCRLAA